MTRCLKPILEKLFSYSTVHHVFRRSFFFGKETQTENNFGKKNTRMLFGYGGCFQPVQGRSKKTGECSDCRQIFWNYVSTMQYFEYLVALICGRSL
jgi:hypothetical protein